jgi:hypothetical protein
MTPLLMTTSAEPSSSRKSSITPCRNSTLRRPIAAVAARDRPSISSVMSTPTTRPSGSTTGRDSLSSSVAKAPLDQIAQFYAID